MLLLSMLLCEALYSQTLTFYYFDKPAVISANFNTGQVSEEPGFDKVLITAANVATFKRSSPPNLVAVYTKLNNTASPLRKSADRLTTISNTIITNINFNLVNDNTGLTANVAEANQFFCRSYDASTALQVAWPCATNSGSDGSVRFGENAAGRNDFESVVIHEISHTQTLSDAQGFNSRYDKGTNYVRIAYGGDAGHYINELQADQQLPMDEAFGNFWGGVHDPVWRTATIAKFTSNREYLLGSHSLLSGTADMWTAPHSVLVSGVVPAIQPGQAFPFFSANGYTLTLISDNLTTGGSRYEARMYRFCDIPGKYVFNSEMLTELYLHLFHK